MPKRPTRWSIVLGLALAVVPAASLRLRASEPARPPDTRREPVVETLHGVEVADPYGWLEDQASPPTRAWIDAENAYTDSVLGSRPGKEGIQRRLAELIKIDTVTVPFVRGGRYFFSKRRADQDLFVLHVRKGPRAADEVLLDPHRLSSDHTVSVSFEDVSVDGRVVAYGVRNGGEDEVTIRLLDVDTRQDLPDVLPRARYSGAALAADKTALYYSRLTPEGPRVFRHAMGSDTARDEEIFGKGYGPEKIIAVGVSDDGRWLLVEVHHGAAAKKVEVYVKDLRKKEPFVAVVNDLEANFSTAVAGDRMYLLTNWKAPHFRVMAADLADPRRERWKEVIPEGRSVIAAVAAAGGRLLVRRLEDVQPRLRVHDADGRAVRDVELPAIGSVGGVSGDWSQDEAFFSFSSLAQPLTIYRYDVPTGKSDVWARLSVPVRSDDVEIQQVWYASKDGTKIPMFVAHRKGIRLDGTNPTLLTGYGGFNLSQLPGFSARAAFWIESGGVYALPSLRGGGEFGEAWHEAGMLDKKQNVFDDFIAAAEWLVARGYTSPSRLAISGGSNGGLLVGAALTQRPELFRAVVCAYPLLDMLRYHRFLVASYWVPEYGSAADAAQFPVLRAYSPYHRVKPGERYPAVLFITGDGDTRVAPLHARKMAALLQASTGSDRPVLLHYDTKAGHSGGLPATKVIEDLTNEMLFLFGQLGMTPPVP
jgi:prolyl oligopeptidase